MEEKKENRGGAREGAGRKPGKVREAVSFALTPDAVAKLNVLSEKSGLSKSALVERLISSMFLYQCGD